MKKLVQAYSGEHLRHELERTAKSDTHVRIIFIYILTILSHSACLFLSVCLRYLTLFTT